MSETTIDTTRRVSFKVSKDTYVELFQASEELPDEPGHSNNRLGRYVRELLTDPAEVDVSEVETPEGRPYTRDIGLYVSGEEWEELRAAFEGTDLSEDYRGDLTVFGNQPFGEFSRKLVLARMED